MEDYVNSFLWRREEDAKKREVAYLTLGISELIGRIGCWPPLRSIVPVDLDARKI